MGNWVTSPFKQYPGDMNLLLATSSVSCWQRLGFISSVDDDVLDHPAMKFFVPLDPFDSNQVLGAFGNDLAKSKTLEQKPRCIPCNLKMHLDSSPPCVSHAHLVTSADLSRLAAAPSVSVADNSVNDLSLSDHIELTGSQIDVVRDNHALALLRRQSKRAHGRAPAPDRRADHRDPPPPGSPVVAQRRSGPSRPESLQGAGAVLRC